MVKREDKFFNDVDQHITNIFKREDVLSSLLFFLNNFSSFSNSVKLKDVLMNFVCTERDGISFELACKLLLKIWLFVDVSPEELNTFVRIINSDYCSQTVFQQSLKALVEMLKAGKGGKVLYDLVMGVALERAIARRASTRSECIKVICAICKDDWCLQSNLLEGLSEVVLKDEDAVVRASAIEGVLTLHERELAMIPLSLWEVGQKAMEDDSEQVRKCAIKMFWLLGTLFPNEHAPSPANWKVVDRCFVILCHGALDPSLTVRKTACEYLGSLPDVRRECLMQSLSKKTIGALEQEGVWDDGEDAPISSQWGSSALQDQQAAGAFVHALEEEFWEVRNSALQSMCDISLRESKFAEKALDYVVDMLHDENSTVRLNAIHSLRRMGASTITLRVDDLNMLHFLLSEDNRRIREAVQHLLQQVKHPDASSFRDTVNCLLNNIIRYPHDLDDVLTSLSGLGKRHPILCELLVEVLLGIDARFIIQERTMNDSIYIATMVLLLSGAQENPKVLTHFPAFALKHVDFLKSKYRDLFFSGKTSDQGDEEKGEIPADFSSNICGLLRNGQYAAAQVLFESVKVKCKPLSLSSLWLSAVRGYFNLCSGKCDETEYKRVLRRVALEMEYHFDGTSERMKENIHLIKTGNWKPSAVDLSSEKAQRCEANVYIDNVEDDLISEFVSFIPLPLSFSGSIKRLSTLSDLSLILVFPDGTHVTHKLDPSDFVSTAPSHWTFTKNIVLNAPQKAWSERCNVAVYVIREIVENESKQDKMVIAFEHEPISPKCSMIAISNACLVSIRPKAIY